MYRVWIALQYKVVRLLYYQFVESGDLAEIPNNNGTEELDQQFEHNVIQPRGNELQVLPSYVVETVLDDTLLEYSETFTSIVTDSGIERQALQDVDATTKFQGLLEVSYDSIDTLLAGYELAKPSLLDLSINKNLLRGLRNRKKTEKARANYTIANLLLVATKAFTVAVNNDEPGIVILKTFKELQQLLEAV